MNFFASNEGMAFTGLEPRVCVSRFDHDNGKSTFRIGAEQGGTDLAFHLTEEQAGMLHHALGDALLGKVTP